MSDRRRFDLGPLEQALTQLKEALAEHERHPDMDVYRDSVVIRFLFTYEPTIQAVRRYVQLEHLKPLSDEELTTPRAVRRANALGILQGEWEDFAPYRDARNAVAHTYSATKAQAVADLAKRFVQHPQYLLDQLKARLND